MMLERFVTKLCGVIIVLGGLWMMMVPYGTLSMTSASLPDEVRSAGFWTMICTYPVKTLLPFVMFGVPALGIILFGGWITVSPPGNPPSL